MNFITITNNTTKQFDFSVGGIGVQLAPAASVTNVPASLKSQVLDIIGTANISVTEPADGGAAFTLPLLATVPAQTASTVATLETAFNSLVADLRANGYMA